SPGIESYAQAQMAAASLEALLPHLAFVNFYFRGYVLLDITHDRLQAEWWVVDNIDSHRYSSDCLRALQVPQGSNQLQPAQGITQAKAAQPLAPAFADDLAFLRHWKQRYNHLDGVLANHTERGAL
ncbi:hypothetical protein Q4595_17290, partial [Wenyingzhuangia sp. 1_MG-2023]|nr:hypothetical protein [Wenyingzhuangia sp. 1_MG-2023]